MTRLPRWATRRTAAPNGAGSQGRAGNLVDDRLDRRGEVRLADVVGDRGEDGVSHDDRRIRRVEHDDRLAPGRPELLDADAVDLVN